MIKQKKGPAFLLKTFDMLEKQQFKQIIDWTAEGTGFVVKNPVQLSQKVLPKYFKHSNMHSFIRQLNMYGFNKKRGSKVENYYFHPLFKKGDRYILNLGRQGISQMQRKAQKKGITRENLREVCNQQVSIELQQNSQSLNKISNKKIQNEFKMQDEKKQVENDDKKILKNAIDLNAMNKILILEQIYHLANISANNLLTYHQTQENLNQKIDQRESLAQIQVIQKFTKTKDEYLKIMSMIWDKINSQIQKYELNMEKNQSISQLKNEQNIDKDQNDQKFLKQTQISIQKLPSKIISYNQQRQNQKINRGLNFQQKHEQIIQKKNQNSEFQSKWIEPM